MADQKRSTLEDLALDQFRVQCQSIPKEILSTQPTDLEVLGRWFGVERVIERKLDVAGLIHRFENQKSVIFLNEDDAPGRRRFSWAHELGHLVLASKARPVTACRTPGQRDAALERSCDVIATEILMPRELFCAEVDGTGWSLRSIRSLANAFQVTVQAAARRLTELIDEPALMSIWRPNGHQALTRLKYSWSIPNTSGKRWSPQVRWQTGPDYMLPLYQSLVDNRMALGRTRVLMKQHGESRYRWVQTEAIAIGRAEHRTILAIHYLSRDRVTTQDSPEY